MEMDRSGSQQLMTLSFVVQWGGGLRESRRSGVCRRERLVVECRKGGRRRAKSRKVRGDNSGGLTEFFEEDVKQRLDVKRTVKDVKTEKGKMQKMLGELDVRKLDRLQVLDLLQKGAWVGLGVLVGYFLVVHFVIVGDFWPK